MIKWTYYNQEFKVMHCHFQSCQIFFYSRILIHLIFIVQFSLFILLIRRAFCWAKVFIGKKSSLCNKSMEFFSMECCFFSVEKKESLEIHKNIGNIFRSEQITKILRLRIFDFFNRCDKGVSYACHWVPSVMVHPSISINTQYIGRKKKLCSLLKSTKQ